MTFISNSFIAGTGANIAGLGLDWTNPTNIQSSDDSKATAALTGVNTDFLRCTNFSFDEHLPIGVQILGVQVELEWGLTAGGAGSLQLDTIELWDGSSTLGTNQAASENVPSSETVEFWGGVGDLWGESRSVVTPSMIRSNGFGVQLKVKRTTNGTVGLDSVRMSVWWRKPRGRNRGRER